MITGTEIQVLKLVVSAISHVHSSKTSQRLDDLTQMLPFDAVS